MERIYSPKDMADLLGIEASTLRKYANILEGVGYSFHKNERGHRGYYDKDVITLRKLKELSEHSDMTLEQSANAVMTWVNASDVSVNATNELAIYERFKSEIAELRDQVAYQQEILKQQTDLIMAMHQKIDAQSQFLSNRDHAIMNGLREIQETRKLIAAAEEEKSKKGFFSSLFSKK
jgi:DNA-binding transcriptional MerR regulator